MSNVVNIAPEVSTAILHRARLGAVRRKLLFDAARWKVQVTEGCRPEYAAIVRRRAARSLAALGLVDLYKAHGINAWGARCPGMLHCRISERGRAVLAACWNEIETGRPIRWSRFDVHAQLA
jgi:hypothetical protein